MHLKHDSKWMSTKRKFPIHNVSEHGVRARAIHDTSKRCWNKTLN